MKRVKVKEDLKKKDFESQFMDKQQYLEVSSALYFAEYELESAVGVGSHSVVCKCIDMKSKDVVCVKVIACYDNFGTCGIPSICLNEICILHHIRHPNLLKVRDVTISNRMILLEYPYYKLGDLHGYIQSCKKRMDLLNVKKIGAQLMMGLEYLHSLSIVHRDLKPGNILLSDEGIVKIADFGVSIPINFVQNQNLTSEVGTLWYRSPELLAGMKKYGKKTDVWSMGCIMCELISGVPLFANQKYDIPGQLIKVFETIQCPTKEDYPELHKSEEYQAACLRKRKLKTPIRTLKSVITRIERRGNRPVKVCDQDALDLVTKMLKIHPKERIDFTEALEHPFFMKILRSIDKKSSRSRTPPRNYKILEKKK